MHLTHKVRQITMKNGVTGRKPRLLRLVATVLFFYILPAVALEVATESGLMRCRPCEWAGLHLYCVYDWLYTTIHGAPGEKTPEHNSPNDKNHRYNVAVDRK